MQKKQIMIGEILMEAGLISETHVRSALAQQKRFGGRIGEHLIKAGLITESQLLDALSNQLGVAKINFRKSHIYLEALKLVNRDICVRYRVIPIAVKAQKGHRKLLLAMADPTNYQAIQEVEFASGHSVVTALAADSEIAKAIEYCYHIDGLRESEGLEEAPDMVELQPGFVGTNDQPIIINPEGEFTTKDNRYKDQEMRALVDLLIDKGVFSRAEFRDRLEKCKAQV
jgi:type IV pilus assembly protein PilB